MFGKSQVICTSAHAHKTHVCQVAGEIWNALPTGQRFCLSTSAALSEGAEMPACLRRRLGRGVNMHLVGWDWANAHLVDDRIAWMRGEIAA
eukprot:2789290-Pyramimonas_sp.AAC.1